MLRYVALQLCYGPCKQYSTAVVPSCLRRRHHHHHHDIIIIIIIVLIIIIITTTTIILIGIIIINSIIIIITSIVLSFSMVRNSQANNYAVSLTELMKVELGWNKAGGSWVD